MWVHGGHKEILNPLARYRLLARERLADLLSIDEAALRSNYAGWIEEGKKTAASREPVRSESIAVGGKQFLERIKEELGFRAIGRKVQEGLETGMGVLREPTCRYSTNSGMKSNL